MALRYSFLSGAYGIYQLPPTANPAPQEGLWSLTRTADELSLVCREGSYPDSRKSEEGWVALKLDGPFDFAVIGIIARISGALATAKVPVFVISTFGTDYVLIKREYQQSAVDALSRAGYRQAI